MHRLSNPVMLIKHGFIQLNVHNNLTLIMMTCCLNAPTNPLSVYNKHVETIDEILSSAGHDVNYS